MRKIRVLVVDDSTVIRRLLTDALTADDTLEVVGAAPNGRIALAKIPQINPDLVTLDIEMPEMDGLATLQAIRKLYPRLPVIMFSTLTQKGAVATLNALSAGASDYVTKPANVGSVTAAIQKVRDDLIPKIRTLCGRSIGEQPATIAPVRRPDSTTQAGRPCIHRASVGIIAIGVSTGGPNALTDIFRQLPADLPVPIVIVQHMPPVFTRYLADRLSHVSAVPVCESRAGELLEPGRAWLAPGDFHLTLARSPLGVVTRLNQGPPENSCRPAVDVLFRSVAEVYGPATLAIVLTGMGYDGCRGSEAIRDAGGRVIAQDEATSVVWGMPGAVARAGLAEELLPLDQIAQRLTSLTADRPNFRPLVTCSH
jgi:two-component system chemotaxis response regulator CheB